ncbi:MAG TPA: efflux RND transporter periplasmic adaptor subunit, partial [Pirellulales bacterium]|nr:efflux RND transporter periplasmic adaptor subunit [Pirellulales bacterium]
MRADLASPVGQSETQAADPKRQVALGELQSCLLEMAMSSPDKASVIRRASEVLEQYSNALASVYFQRDQASKWQPSDKDVVDDLNTTFGLAVEQWAAWCDQAAAERQLQYFRLDGVLPLTVIAVPVSVPGGTPEVLCVAFRTAKKPAHGVVILLQNLAAHFTMWFQGQRCLQFDRESDDLAALIELIGRIENSDSLKRAAFVVANHMQTYLKCQRVAVGLMHSDQKRCQLQALSGISKFDKSSAYVLEVESALDETVLKDELTIWSRQQTNDVQAALAHQRLCTRDSTTTVISAPLRTSEGRLVGAWLFLDDNTLVNSSASISMIEAGSSSIADSLAVVEDARSSVSRRLVRAAESHLRSRWLKATAIGTAIVVAVLCLPLKYKLTCDVTVEPVSRRFVAAPFDSTLQKTLVRPGDLVKQDSTLAMLDGRELRMEMAGLEAEWEQAGKRRDAALAARKTGEAQIAKLEMEHLELQLNLLRHRTSQLQIGSPTDGIVVTGDLERVEGAPLTVGQTLFEIAPLDQMIVEIAIPQSEVAYAQPGMTVQVKLASYP